VRDPRRIDVMLQLLRDVWMRSPDMRLGQLISCCVPERFDMDPFYVEDDELFARMQQRQREWNSR
jgi:hypothetical protein